MSPTITGEEAFGYSEKPEDGWRQVTFERGEEHVYSRNGLHLRVHIAQVGEDGSVRLPAMRDRYTPGYAALLSPEHPPANGTRIYLAAQYSRVPALGRIVSMNIEKVTRSYVVKALNSHRSYPRSDAVTIYVPNSARDAMLGLLDHLHVGDYLSVPQVHSAFARVETSGVGWMESSADTSGGYERAACVARAVTNQMTRDSQGTLEDAIEDEFRAAGIDTVRPHLYLT